MELQREIRLTLRLPEGVRDCVDEWARSERRSLNQQIVHLLEQLCDSRPQQPRPRT